MAKKYLNLEEAAERIGSTVEQLLRLREEGQIRGFADRGSWKFREQDVEEFVRSQQADSSPDMPILSADADDDEGSVLDDDEGKVELDSSDSDVRLFFDESLFDDDEEDDLSVSDSDVQLSGDSGPNLEGGDSTVDAGSVLEFDEADQGVRQSDSDSDVKLISAGTDADLDLLGGDTVRSDEHAGDYLPGFETEAEIDLTAEGPAADDSDSDILLTEPPVAESDDSDSDVSLTDDRRGEDADSDSDVLLSDSDSDVRLSADSSEDVFSGSDSDSDVHLQADSDVQADDSDSDVKLGVDRTDSDIRLVEASQETDDTAATEPALQMPEDSDLKLIDSEQDAEQDDSGITLETAALSLDADESGISLEIDDSGISLEADDSGISLESLDSGTGFASDDDDDSGITLDAGDSGIALFEDDDSGLTLDEADMNQTMPMQAVPGAADALAESSGDRTTSMAIPDEGTADSDFELAGLNQDDDDVGTDTSVLMFEDEDALDSAPTMQAAAVESDLEEAYGEEEFDDEYEEDLDDVWDAEDEIDETGFEAGESDGTDFAVPVAAGTRVVTDAPWGAGWTTAVSFAALFSVISAFIGIELVRTMWLWTQPGQTESWLLSMLGGMF